jgi:hypothetical protein
MSFVPVKKPNAGPAPINIPVVIYLSSQVLPITLSLVTDDHVRKMNIRLD